jgi:DNA-binding beta-propeller fold protein YncE
VIEGSNLYIVDEGNYRIVRVDTASGAATGWIGYGNGWQSMATQPPLSGSNLPDRFNRPSAIATDGTYLYIADRLNNRISRWAISTGNFAGWVGHGKIGWEMTASAPASDPYAGVSYYPPDYYAEPHGLALVIAAQKGTKNKYLYVTSVYNGRVTRINLDCVDAPSSDACNPNLADPFTP